jgi:hypothetical protein
MIVQPSPEGGTDLLQSSYDRLNTPADFFKIRLDMLGSVILMLSDLYDFSPEFLYAAALVSPDFRAYRPTPADNRPVRT